MTAAELAVAVAPVATPHALPRLPRARTTDAIHGSPVALTRHAMPRVPGVERSGRGGVHELRAAAPQRCRSPKRRAEDLAVEAPRARVGSRTTAEVPLLRRRDPAEGRPLQALLGSRRRGLLSRARAAPPLARQLRELGRCISSASARCSCSVRSACCRSRRACCSRSPTTRFRSSRRARPVQNEEDVARDADQAPVEDGARGHPASRAAQQEAGLRRHAARRRARSATPRTSSCCRSRSTTS